MKSLITVLMLSNHLFTVVFSLENKMNVDIGKEGYELLENISKLLDNETLLTHKQEIQGPIKYERLDNISALITNTTLLTQKRGLAKEYLSKISKKGCLTTHILLKRNAEINRDLGCSKGFLRNSVCTFKCQKYFKFSAKYENYAHSKCTTSGRWDPEIPLCIPVKACPGPILPYGLHFVKDCSKAVGSICRVKCAKKLYQFGPNVIACQSTGFWTEVPQCGCPKPILSETILFDGNCPPHIGEQCQFRCPKNFILKGSKISTCTVDGKWTEIPTCEPKCELPSGCEEKVEETKVTETKVVETKVAENISKSECPELDEKYIVKKKCFRDEGSSCEVFCKKGFVLLGSRNIKCLQGSWSSLPECKSTAKMSARQKKCSIAKMPKDVVFIKPACKLSKKFTCQVKCRKSSAKSKRNKKHKTRKAKCNKKGEWKNLPTCHSKQSKEKRSKQKCPELEKRLILKTKCLRNEGSSCKVSCEKDFVLIGSHNIKCLKGKWSSLPKCESTLNMSARQKNCSTAIIPKNIVFTPPACKASKNFTCKVKCRTSSVRSKSNEKYESKYKTANCTLEGKWTNLPKCKRRKRSKEKKHKNQCPKPSAFKGMKISRKCLRLDGTKCRVSCKKNYILVGDNNIQCSKRKWSRFPICKSSLKMSLRQKRCSKALTPKIIAFESLKCKASTKFKCIVGCKTKIFLPGTKNTPLIGVFARTAMCTPKGVWINIPNCKGAKEKYWYQRIRNSQCSKPIATTNLIIQEPCSRIDSSVCKVSCKEETILTGPQTIKCMKKKWSAFPVCNSISNKTIS